MSDLDRLAQYHAEVLRDSVADAVRPELIASSRTLMVRRGLMVAAAAAVVAVVVIAPLAWRPTQTPPAPDPTTPGDVVATTSEPATTTSTVTTMSTVTTTSDGATQATFDIERFASALLDGAFGGDETRIGMVVLVPASTDIADLLSQLPELADHLHISADVVAEFAVAYAEQRRMEPLQGAWQAYGLIPEYSGSPLWDWEPEVRRVPDAVFALNTAFENPVIRVPEGWSVLTEIAPELPSGSLKVATNDGLVIVDSAATTIVGTDGTIRGGEPSPAPIPDACCGDAVAYSTGDGVLLLYRGEGAWLLDTVAVAWREVDPLPWEAHPVGTAVYPLGMAQIGDQLYVVASAPRTANATSEVTALDVGTGTWRSVDPVPAPITVGGVTTDGTRLIVAGTHQNANNGVIGDRNPVAYTYADADADAWSQLPSVSIDGQASTITWVDGAGLLAWNYDQESALLDESQVWRNLDNVPMDFSECYPISVPIASGAAGRCGGLAWFNGESATWIPIDAPNDGQLALTSNAAYSISSGAGHTTVLQYPLPPAD